MRFNGHTAKYFTYFIFTLFSGASSGIGAATAIEFAKHGVKLAINGRNAENLEKTAKKCYEAGLKETEVKNSLNVCDQLQKRSITN